MDAMKFDPWFLLLVTCRVQLTHFLPAPDSTGSRSAHNQHSTRQTRLSPAHALSGSVNHVPPRYYKCYSSNNAIHPSTYITRICAMEKGQSGCRNESEEQRWRSSCVATNNVSGWHLMERIPPRHYVIAKTVLRVILPKRWFFFFSLLYAPLMTANIRIPSLFFCFFTHRVIDRSSVRLDCSHSKRFWPVFTAPCGEPALCLPSRESCREWNNCQGGYVWNKTDCCNGPCPPIGPQMKSLEATLRLLRVSRFIGIYAWFQELNAFGHPSHPQVQSLIPS